MGKTYYRKPKKVERPIRVDTKTKEYRQRSSEEQMEAFQQYRDERKKIEQSDLPSLEKSKQISELLSRYNKQIKEIQEKYRRLING